MIHGRNGNKKRANAHGLELSVLRLHEQARERQVAGLVGAERRAELGLAAAFLAVAVPLALLLPAGRSLSLAPAVASVLAYALAARVEFHTGSGWTVPTQLVFVPMLFVLPGPIVPLLVAAALLLAKLPEYANGALHGDRAVIAIGDGSYTLGPVAVLSLAGAETPQWGDWPIYVAALGAQLAIHGLVSAIRGRLGLGLPLRPHLRELGLVFLVDAILAPIGLLAALASTGNTYAFVAVLPLVGLLALFAREREARIESAITLAHAYRGTALLLGDLISASDEYTGAHSRSVVVLSHRVGEALGLDEDQIRDIELGALLHDVGKLSVPKSILNKPGALTEDEFDVVKGHVVEGQGMLERIGGVLAEAGYVVRTHHERFDGTGYPDGLAGKEIPITARIVACCDAFNAMTTDRPYRSALPVRDALTELRAHAGTQFDPRVVDALTEIVEEWERRAGNGAGIAPHAKGSMQTA
jgi:hypothetical protein